MSTKKTQDTAPQKYFSPLPTGGFNKGLFKIEGNISDRSSANDQFTTAHSNISTPNSQGRAPLSLQPTLSQKFNAVL